MIRHKQIEFSPDARLVQHLKISQLFHHINRLEKKLSQ